MRRIKVKDDVVILAGKDKGKRGTVIQLVGEDRVIVENINVVSKHQRPNPQRGIPGGIVPTAMPIHISNVALYNPAKNGPDRVGFKVLEDGRKVRVFKSNDEVVSV